MLTVLCLLVNTETIMLDVERTYEFSSGINILYLTYFNYANMDVCFC